MLKVHKKSVARDSPRPSPETETESCAAQSSEAASGIPEPFSLKSLRVELMTHEQLQPSTRLGVVERLRDMMQRQEAGAEQWLRAIVTLPGWNDAFLVALLTDDRVQDSPDEDSSSLLRAALPHYLSILLSLDAAVTAPLIENLFYKVDEARGTTGIQQLIDKGDFDSLKLVFTTLKRHPDLLKELPNLAPSFRGASVDKLLDFARAKGGDDNGPKFHELTGRRVLLQRKTDEVLNLIDALLTRNASSDGIALYLWYVTATPVDEIFHKEFFARQRSKFGTDCTADFIQNFLSGRTFSSDPVAQRFINRLRDVELVRLAIFLFNAWYTAHNAYTPSFSTDTLTFSFMGSGVAPRGLQVRQNTENNFFAMLRFRPDAVDDLLKGVHVNNNFSRDLFARLFVLDSIDHIPLVIAYYRRLFPLPDIHGNGAVFINNLMRYAQGSPDRRRCIVQNLQLCEIESLLDSGRIPRGIVLGNLAPGTLPFAVMGRYLHAASRIRRNCYGEIVSARYSNDLIHNIPAGVFTGLADDLVCYRAKRNDNPEQRYSFMGISSGISKDEKFAVVNKILTFIYGTEDEKQAAGPFTTRELRVMNQGRLGRVIRERRGDMALILQSAASMTPDVAGSAPATSSMR